MLFHTLIIRGWSLDRMALWQTRPTRGLEHELDALELVSLGVNHMFYLNLLLQNPKQTISIIR
jgi:hypothetical protein